MSEFKARSPQVLATWNPGNGPLPLRPLDKRLIEDVKAYVRRNGYPVEIQVMAYMRPDAVVGVEKDEPEDRDGT